MEASYQTAALTASGLSWAAVQQLSAISGGLETRRPKIDLRSRWINPNKGSNFPSFIGSAHGGAPDLGAVHWQMAGSLRPQPGCDLPRGAPAGGGWACRTSPPWARLGS